MHAHSFLADGDFKKTMSCQLLSHCVFSMQSNHNLASLHSHRYNHDNKQRFHACTGLPWRGNNHFHPLLTRPVPPSPHQFHSLRFYLSPQSLTLASLEQTWGLLQCPLWKPFSQSQLTLHCHCGLAGWLATTKKGDQRDAHTVHTHTHTHKIWCHIMHGHGEGVYYTVKMELKPLNCRSHTGTVHTHTHTHSCSILHKCIRP